VQLRVRASTAGVSKDVAEVSSCVALFIPSPAPRQGVLSSSSSGGHHHHRHGERGRGDILLGHEHPQLGAGTDNEDREHNGSMDMLAHHNSSPAGLFSNLVIQDFKSV
jgi:hypothetical protein